MNHPKLLTIAISLAILASLAGAQTNVAIIPLDAKGVSDIEASVLTDRLAFELFKTGLFTVLERGKMEEILTEQNFQLTGCVTEECLVEVGQLLGVEQMMAGSVSKIGNTYSVILRLIDARSGAIVQVAGYDHQGTIDQLLSQGMGVVASSIAGIEDSRTVGRDIGANIDRTSQAPIGHIYLLPNLGIGAQELGFAIAGGLKLGYGNNSWGKALVDVEIISGSMSNIDRGAEWNTFVLFEPASGPFFSQYGAGLIVSPNGHLGIRYCLGYNYYSGDYLIIRSALAISLALGDFEASNISLTVNFGFKTPNLW